MDVMAHPMTPEESGEAMVSYARRYPKAAKLICRQVGYRVDGSEEDYRTVGQEAIPFVELQQMDNGGLRHDTVGEIWLILDDGAEVHLTPGDCVVQNGTQHAWHNRISEPCVMAGVTVGAKRQA
jgi:mannose-6-phosphate isomerase-like protein (cupin superfamily)